MNEIKTSEISELQQAGYTYWDFYKEAFGFRPRDVDTSTWTLEDFHREFESLAAICQQNAVQSGLDEAAAVVAFESRVATMIEVEGHDRLTALRAIAKAEDATNDPEYLCFLLGLPYKYFAGDFF
jgi:hypothetical protein